MRYLKLYERFYKPSDEIKDELDKLVKDLVLKYHGGRKFFDELDNSIKRILSKDIIISLSKGNPNEWIASSGEFGDIVYKLWMEGKIKCKGLVVFNGKINTYDLNVISYYPEDFNLNNKEFIYIDDSLFSGKTYHRIDDFLKKYNSKIKSVSVIYDGSRIKDKKINSFFRYYN